MQTATIHFDMSEPVLRYFRDGEQNRWQPISGVHVVRGCVDPDKRPRYIWTGDGGNTGWIIAQVHFDPASSSRLELGPASPACSSDALRTSGRATHMDTVVRTSPSSPIAMR